jgi:hypothetical protein
VGRLYKALSVAAPKVGGMKLGPVKAAVSRRHHAARQLHAGFTFLHAPGHRL